MKPGKIDKNAVCRELDLAADKFETMGYTDLSKKVDYYADRLRKASGKDIPKIYRALSRIQADYSKRASKDTRPDNEKKATHATRTARRVSDRKNVVLARRLKEKEAALKKANQEISRLKDLLKIARKRAFGNKGEQKTKKALDTPEKRAEARRARMRSRRRK